MRPLHSPEQITAYTEQPPVLKVRVEVCEVPYEQLDPVQRETWDWLWRRLLGPGPETTMAPGALTTPEATSDCSNPEQKELTTCPILPHNPPGA